MAISETIASVLLIIATLLVVATVVSLWRAPDALTRANLLGPTVGLAVPLIIVAKLVVDFGRDGFSLWLLIQALIACFGVWIIGSVGSFYLGRSIYGVTVTDVKHAKHNNKEVQTVQAEEDDI